MPTIARAIAEASQELLDAGVSEERLTANLLMGHALSIERTQVLVRANEQLPDASYQAFLKLIERRAAGEPLQYITGHQEFYGLDFCVTPAVLIPRPETEFLVEQVIKLSEPAGRDRLIVDAGTGSGCIAVALAHHLNKARVMATDISPAALAVARDNARRHHVESRIEFLEGDLFAPLEGRGLEGKVDIVASNPPYVPLGDAPTLQREVRDWEPHTALFAGADGLAFYRRLLAESRIYLKPGGHLVCEIGYAQIEAITRLIDSRVWQLEEVTNDLQAIPRTLTIRRLY